MNRTRLLSEPLQVGTLRLRNRCVVPGHSMRLSSGDGIGPRLHAYLVERARGGAAWIGLESCPVEPSTRVALSPLPLYAPEIVGDLAALAHDIHAAGAVLSVLLWHGGHNVPQVDGRVAIAASAIPSPVTGEVPKAADAADLHRVVAAYVRAAAHAADAGIDVVEVQTSSDYLLGSFLSPRLNLRSDAYGGSRGNRMRLLVEVLEGVRRSVAGRCLVGIRTSAAHLIPGDPQDYGGVETLAILESLRERGLIDYVSVLAGSHWSMEQMIAPMTVRAPDLAAFGQRCRRRLGIPVILTGSFRTAHEADRLLADGAADLIGLVRPWIAEPEWFNRVLAGEEDRVRPCVSCNQGCLGAVARGLAGGCVLNARAGLETDRPRLRRLDGPTSVAVVGGGPAGLECARVLAERGARVTLYERRRALGGMLDVAAQAPGRERWRLALDWWARELARLRVDVRLATEYVHDDGHAHVVWAVGAIASQVAVLRRRPWLVNGIPGTRDLAHGRDLLERRLEGLSGTVTVIDEEGGWPLLSLVRTLLATPAVACVQVLAADPVVGGHELAYTLEAGAVLRPIAGRLEVEAGVTVRDLADGVVFLDGGRETAAGDHVILSTGASSRARPADVMAIGDCVSPRGVLAAVHEGWMAGARLAGG